VREEYDITITYKVTIMSAENPFKNVPKTKETIEKYVVTEGENAGRLKADTPEALEFARTVADKEQSLYVSAAEEYAQAGTKMTVEDVENEINAYIKKSISNEAASGVIQEGEQLLKEMREHPEYRKEGDIRSGYSKEFLDRLEQVRKHMHETYHKSMDETGTVLEKTGEGA
jgi:hypothetical protein